MNSAAPTHIPVLAQEVLELAHAVSHPVRNICDATFGRGGHSRLLLQAFPQAKLWALDQDAEAIDHAKENFSTEIASGRMHVLHENFSDYDFNSKFDFILADLGVSSPQLDQAARGFSFYNDGPLDMRMDQRQELTAQEILQNYDEEDLIRVFKELGEVRSPFRVVRAIVHDRQSKVFSSTKDLAEMIARIDGWRKKGAHPATLYFMALRLEVNQELARMQAALPRMIASLAPGGVLAVISFHSLEDRIVKNLFKTSPSMGKMMNKKVIVAQDAEIASNPRSRSAKLRGFQRLDDNEEIEK